MAKQDFVWPVFRLPEDLGEDENFLINLKSVFTSQATTDTPSGSDLAAIIRKFNAATEAEREAMNNVFIWATGWTLQRLAAYALTNDRDSADDLYEKWEKISGRVKET